MRVRIWGLVVGLAAMLPGAAEACHSCGRNPCAMPAYRPVTEMVPYTVMKTRMRTEFVPKQITVMAKEPVTHWVSKTIVCRRPVYDTTYVQRVRTVCRPQFDTTWVTQTSTICRPVTSTREVTSYCLQPTSWTEAVPATCKPGCGIGGLCGHKAPHAGVNYVTKTCYTQVPVTRTVVDVQMVPETVSRQVPVTSCRMITEQKVENVPVTHCRLVTETKTIQVPVTTFRCVPKTITKMVPVCVPETVPVTCYRPVTRMVPCAPAAPVHYAAAQTFAPASPQGVTPAAQN